MAGLEVRGAKPADKNEVLSFCVGTFDWGDYIDEVFDRWLDGADSLFLVAEAEGKPVGILHARLMKHQRAWLEGLRVRPSHRRSGVGSALTLKAIERLRDSGFRTVHLLIESNNEASKGLAMHAGFREETQWAFYHGRSPARLASEDSRWLTSSAGPRVWAQLDASDVFNRATRSFEYDWALYPLESDDFADLVKRRRVAVSGRGAHMTVAVVDDGSGSHRLARACFLPGDASQVEDLAAFVVSEAAKAEARRLHVSCPNHAGVVEGLKASGFRAAFRASSVYVREV